jgi:hypothetical protein
MLIATRFDDGGYAVWCARALLKRAKRGLSSRFFLLGAGVLPLNAQIWQFY